MSIAKIYSDQSRRIDWTVREDTDATLTLTVTQNSSAYDLSSTTFIAEFFEVGSSTAFLTLTQGSGLTNGGAAGTLTIALTDTQLNLTPNDYWWKLRTTAPTDYLWFNGVFKVNGYLWDGGTDYSVSVALTVANNNINVSLITNGSGGGGGTVTSFSAGNLTPLFTSSVANSTNTPALSFSQIAKNANTVFAGPATGSAANPDFRVLVAADIPDISATYQPINLAALKANNLSDLASASTARTNLGLGTLATQSGTFTDKQDLVNSATALVDGATIDLTAIKHTLSTSLGRTFTISYTGDDITLIITLSATSATFTFPATTLCVTNGTASGDNTMAFTGVVSGDKLVIAIKKVGSDYYAIGKNFGQ